MLTDHSHGIQPSYMRLKRCVDTAWLINSLTCCSTANGLPGDGPCSFADIRFITDLAKATRFLSIRAATPPANVHEIMLAQGVGQQECLGSITLHACGCWCSRTCSLHVFQTMHHSVRFSCITNVFPCTFSSQCWQPRLPSAIGVERLQHTIPEKHMHRARHTRHYQVVSAPAR